MVGLDDHRSRHDLHGCACADQVMDTVPEGLAMDPIVLIRRWAILALVVFAFDWVLGALIVAGVLWEWTFALLNPPFGLLYTWMGSYWTGTQTNIGGHVLSDELGLLVVPMVAVFQAGLYAVLWCFIELRRQRMGKL
jgi:hypothetical protein